MCSLVQLSCGEEHCKQISLACVGSARSVWATLGLPPLTTRVLSWSTLLRLQVALPGNCLRRALGCMHFLGLRHLVQVLGYPYRDTDSAECFVPFPGPSSSGDQVVAECTLPSWMVHLITSSVPAAGFPGCIAGVPSQVCFVSILGR